MSRILLVKLSNTSLYKTKNLTLLEPLGLEYIASAIKGHEVIMLDLDYQSLKELKRVITEYKPDVVGTTVSTPMILEARQLVKIVKEINSDIKVVIGGGHPSALPILSLKDTGADIAIVGEGESIINRVIESLNKEVYIGSLQPIDSLEFPARNLLVRENYKCSYSFNGNGFQKCASIITSRGCPFSCNYCASKTILGQKVRFRNINNVIDEIEELILNYGIESILFLDDCFTLKEIRIIDLCTEIINRKLKFYWWLDTRVDCVSKEILNLMYEAGCRFIVYGVESGSQRILDRIGKKITVDKIREAFKITHEVGINTKANFMFGHLDEDYCDISDSINLAKELYATKYGFYLVLPLPGSELYKIAKDRGVITKKFDRFKWYDEPVSNISKISPEHLLKFQKIAYKTCL